MRAAVLWTALAVAVLLAGTAGAQQVTIGTPNNTISDGFFEQMGTNWGLNWDGGFLRVGGAGMAPPPFGGFDPSAGASGGFGFGGRGLGGFFNWAGSQGYRQNYTSQTPMVTMMNGQQAYFSDTSQSPFVMGVIPVVGGFPIGPYAGGYVGQPGYSMSAPGGVLPVSNPHNDRVQQWRQQLAQRQEAVAAGAAEAMRQPRPAAKPPAGPDEADLDLAGPPVVGGPPASPQQQLNAAQASSAGRPVPSVAEARRMHESEQTSGNNEATVLFERGRTAEEDGKPGVAKVYYRMALKQAAGPFREQVQARLDALSSPGTP